MPSFLIIQTASIGDVILATPLIEKLRQFYPESRIDFLLKKGTEGLFKGHPKLNHCYIWDKSTDKYKNFLTILGAVQDVKYDYVINIQRFASTGLLTTFSRAGKTIGFSKNPFSVFFGKRIKHSIKKGEIHEVERNLSLIEFLSDNSFFKPKLYPSKTDYALVSQYKTAKFITVAPASLWFTKQFPEDKWVEFLSEIDEDLNVYFLGSEKDSPLCTRIIDQIKPGRCLNLAGKLSLLQTAALIKDAYMNFVNDSAPQHLASSVNAKTTTIFCSTIPAFGFGPLSDSSVVVETNEKLDCRPCGLHGLEKCPEKHFKCAYSIDKQQLLSRL